MRGKRSHKGKTRSYTAPEEIDRQRGVHAKDGDQSLIDSDTDLSTLPGPSDPPIQSVEDSSDQEQDGDVRHKGVSHLIDVANPNLDKNRGVVRPSRKEVELAARLVADPLSLKSEQELEREMARLALVRKQREQAALKREKEKEAREAQRQAAHERVQAKLDASRQKSSKSKRKGSQNQSATTTDIQNQQHSTKNISNDTS